MADAAVGARNDIALNAELEYNLCHAAERQPGTAVLPKLRCFDLEWQGTLLQNQECSQDVSAALHTWFK